MPNTNDGADAQSRVLNLVEPAPAKKQARKTAKPKKNLRKPAGKAKKAGAGKKAPKRRVAKKRS
jgi:hypothetical protein